MFFFDNSTWKKWNNGMVERWNIGYEKRVVSWSLPLMHSANDKLVEVHVIEGAGIRRI